MYLLSVFFYFFIFFKLGTQFYCIIGIVSAFQINSILIITLKELKKSPVKHYEV